MQLKPQKTLYISQNVCLCQHSVSTPPLKRSQKPQVWPVPCLLRLTLFVSVHHNARLWVQSVGHRVQRLTCKNTMKRTPGPSSIVQLSVLWTRPGTGCCCSSSRIFWGTSAQVLWVSGAAWGMLRCTAGVLLPGGPPA
jgi:hypothetical protein